MQQKLWRPISHDLKFVNEKLHIQGEFTKENGKIRVLYGYDQYILSSKKDSQPTKFLMLDFDMKFEILRKSIPKKDKDDDSLGPIIGLQFLRDQKENMVKFRLNAEVQQIVEWRSYLRGRINQWQFHSMFRVFKKIGKGNFASVYQAERIEDNKQMAIKAFAKQGAYQEENGKNSIINELNIMRQLNNTHLMKLYEVYETKNSLYVTLELLEGGSLQGQSKNQYQINITNNCGYSVRTLRDALKRNYAQRFEIREQKTKMESVVIADFGLATYVNEPVYLFCRCGTPGFVAPEVINIKDMKSKYSSICDIYSLGLVFYLLLTGKSAFNGKSYSTVVKQNREANINFDIKQLQNLPGYAIDLLKQMLEKDPKKRIDTESCLNHPFLFDTTRYMIKDENQDSSFDEIDEKIQIPMLPQMNDNYFQFDFTNNSSSPIQSPGLVMQKLVKQQKQIDSQKAVEADSPLIKGKIESVDSAQTIGTPTKKISLFSPSPQLKPSRFSKQTDNNLLLRYAKKD